MLRDGPVKGTAREAIERIDLVVNGVPTSVAALRGQCYVFAAAKALGALQDFASDSGPVLAGAVASSAGWFGNAIAAGSALAPPFPPGLPAALAPVVATTGVASAVAYAGCGATVASAESQMAFLIGLAAVVVDPRGSGSAGTTLRAFARFVDGSEREFWRARVSFASAPTGNPALTVTDPLNLLNASQFTSFTLRDRRAGARLTERGGIDLLIPLDPAVLRGGPAGPVELRFEAQTDAAVAVESVNRYTQKRLAERVTRLAVTTARTRQLAETTASIRGAATVLRSGSDISTTGTATQLLRHARASAVEAARFDIARQVTRLLQGVTGVDVRLPDLLAVQMLGLDTPLSLTPARLEILGDDTRTPENTAVRIEVNGRTADAVVFGLEPSVTDGTSQGRVAWAFGTRRREDVACAACPSDLGLTSGQNLILVTVSDRRSGKVIGVADALVVLRAHGAPDRRPHTSVDGGGRKRTTSAGRFFPAGRRTVVR